MALTLSFEDAEEKRKVREQDRLRKFLFLLLRDHITWGEMDTILSEICEDSFILCSSSAGVLEYIEEVIKRILG